MKPLPVCYLLIGALFMALTACGPDPGAFEREKEALISRYDSLGSMTDARIANLKASGQAGTSMDENAIRQEIGQLEQLKTRLSTERDQLQMAQARNWRHFRDSLQNNLREIDEEYFPGPE